ncbi:MAG: hypothetical protein ACU0B1_02865 [Thermohalobaculum sp.]
MSALMAPRLYRRSIAAPRNATFTERSLSIVLADVLAVSALW